MKNEKTLLQGFNNENLLFSEGNGKYILRIHKENVRTFEKYSFPEKQILSFLEANGFPAPVVVSSDEKAKSLVLRYIEGDTLDSIYGSSGQLPDWIPGKIARYMVRLHGLDAGVLAGTFDRDVFLSEKLEECEKIRVTLEKDFPGLFGLLLFPPRFSFHEFQPGFGLTGYLGPVKPSLCHFDVNRKNVIIRESGDDCIIIDWEAAGIGDPLCDVAIHLQKMRYSPENERQFIDSFFSGSRCPDRESEVIGLYRKIETIKYAYTDVVRIFEMVSDGSYSKEAVDRAISRYYFKYRKAFDVWNRSCPLSQEHLESIIREYARSAG